ncbi:hypothetical protein BGZ46_010013, partial [Entomortierella lignicola]
KSKTLVPKILALALAGCLFVDNTHATNAKWSSMNYDQVYATGQQATQLSGHVTPSGIGGCAVGVAGMVAAAAGAVACALIPPPTEIACVGSGAMTWFAGLFTTCMTMAAYECNSIGQNFSGDIGDIRCAVAEFIVQNSPPGGVPSDLYMKQIKILAIMCAMLLISGLDSAHAAPSIDRKGGLAGEQTAPSIHRSIDRKGGSAGEQTAPKLHLSDDPKEAWFPRPAILRSDDPSDAYQYSTINISLNITIYIMTFPVIGQRIKLSDDEVRDYFIECRSQDWVMASFRERAFTHMELKDYYKANPHELEKYHAISGAVEMRYGYGHDSIAFNVEHGIITTCLAGTQNGVRLDENLGVGENVMKFAADFPHSKIFTYIQPDDPFSGDECLLGVIKKYRHGYRQEVWLIFVE